MIENPIVPPYSIFCPPPLLSLSHDFSQYSSMCSKKTTQNAQLIECGPSMRGCGARWRGSDPRPPENEKILNLILKLSKICLGLLPPGKHYDFTLGPLPHPIGKKSGTAHCSNRLFEDTWIINHIPYKLNQTRVLCDCHSISLRLLCDMRLNVRRNILITVLKRTPTFSVLQIDNS